MRKNPQFFKADSAFMVLGPRFAGKRLLTVHDELYTRLEAMQALGVTSAQLETLVRDRRLPYVNFGGIPFFPVGDLDAMPREARQTLVGPGSRRLLAISEMRRLRDKGLSPSAIARELGIGESVVLDTLLQTGTQPAKLGAKKTRRRGTKVEDVFPSDDTFVTVMFMHLNGYSAEEIRRSTDLDDDTVSIITQGVDRKLRGIDYPDRLDRERGFILRALFVEHEDFETIAQMYGAAEKELVLFVLANRNRWPRDIARNPRRMRGNPFTIRSGFAIVASTTGRSHITGRDDMVDLQNAAELLGLPADDLRLLVEAKMIPHIVFGGEIFFPFSDLDVADKGDLAEVARHVRRVGSVQRNGRRGELFLGLLLAGTLALFAKLRS